MATSLVALPETAAALARVGRQEILDSEGVASLLSGLHRRWQELVAMEVNETSAAELAAEHAFRGFDAIHLGAALDLREAATPGVEVRFCLFDQRLNAAAGAEGFQRQSVKNPTSSLAVTSGSLVTTGI